MEWRYSLEKLSVVADMNIVSRYHHGSKIYLKSGSSTVKRGIQILVKHAKDDTTAIHPDYDILNVLNKYLPNFGSSKELLVLAGNLVELDWGLYSEYVYETETDTLNWYDEASIGLNELKKLMLLKQSQNVNGRYVSITINSNVPKISDKGKSTRGKNKYVIDKARKVQLIFEDETQFIIDQIIKYKVGNLALNPLIAEVMPDIGNEQFNLEHIDSLLKATSLNFKSLTAESLFKQQFITVLSKFLNEEYKNKECKNDGVIEEDKDCVLYSILLLFGFVSPENQRKHNIKRKKANYVSMLRSKGENKSEKQYPLIQSEDIRYISKEEFIEEFNKRK